MKSPQLGPEAQQVVQELTKLRGLPRSHARSITPAYYTSAQFLELEKERLFRKEWICVGHMGEIPRAGDYFATELVGEPLIILRDSDSRVRAFSNVCRHRGNIVARGAGNASRLTCGYHAWSYSLEGRLLAAPLMESLDRSTCSLPEFATEIWQGFIFVNLAPPARPLGPGLQAMEPFIRNYHPAERNFLYGVEETWATNWKCLAENFMEGYHLSPTHPRTLHPITPTSGCEKLPDAPAFTGYRSNFDPSCPERGPYHPDLTTLERRSDVFYWIFPSLVVGFCPHFTLYMCLRPLTVDQVGIRWGLVGVPSDRDSQVVRDYIQLCKNFCAEDRATLEGLQQGLKSRHYTGGPLAGDDYEGTIWDMLHYMSRRLGDDSA